MRNHSNENEFDLHENVREGEILFHMNDLKFAKEENYLAKF